MLKFSTLLCLAALSAALLMPGFSGPALAGAKDDMLATDRAFSAMSAAKGQQAAFLAYMADDVQLYTGPKPPLLGKAAVAAFYAKNPSGPGEKLIWSPSGAEASPDGILGYTRGTWRYSATAKNGKPVTATGYYVTAWKRQADGTYKFVLDIGGSDKPAKAE